MLGLASYLLFIGILAILMRVASIGGRRDANAAAAMVAARVR
jgi:hypothetical protein